jgi:hypothetical protein
MVLPGYRRLSGVVGSSPRIESGAGSSGLEPTYDPAPIGVVRGV